MSTTSLSKLSSGDGLQTNAGYRVWKHVVPLPPESLMWSTGGASIENFMVVGDAWAQLVSHFMPENAFVLDIGCGCGRTARVLLNNRWISKYVGFDVIQQNVEWCNRFIAPAWKASAEFYWFDLFSAEYNPAGAIRASEFHFPVAPRSMDVVFAASLFTHLLEPDAFHYLEEVGQCLTSRGRALLSIHNVPAPGTRFSGNEARIDIASDYFAELGLRAGLREIERIDEVGGQEVFVFGRRP